MHLIQQIMTMPIYSQKGVVIRHLDRSQPVGKLPADSLPTAHRQLADLELSENRKPDGAT